MYFIFLPLFRSHLKLIWSFLLFSCIISGLLFFRIRAKKYEEKSLEFQTISNAEDDALDLEQRLKRADLFISDFVPKEYTGYLQRVNEKRVQKRALLVEADEANMILNANEGTAKPSSTSTSTTPSTPTTPISTTTSTTTTSRPTTTRSLGALERTVQDLKERIQLMNKNSKIDPRLIRMLNETISVEPNQEIVVIVQSMVEKLENEQEELENESADPEVNEVVLDECADISAFKILPHDDMETARRKQGQLIKCYMDESVDPCERFYDYACGNWNSYHPIPRDRGGYDTFEILREDLDAKLKNMLSERVTELDNNATSATKILYSSCMNTSKNNLSF